MKIEQLIIIFLLVFLFSCTTKSDNSESGRLQIVTTTGMLYDAALNIVKDKAEVEALMRPG